MQPYNQRLHYVQEYGLQVSQIVIQVANIITYEAGSWMKALDVVVFCIIGAALGLPIYALVSRSRDIQVAF